MGRMSASEPFDGTRDQGGHHNRFLTQRERQEKIVTLCRLKPRATEKDITLYYDKYRNIRDLR